MRALIAAVGALLCAGGVAGAAPVPGEPAPPAPRPATRVALAPLTALIVGERKLGPTEALVQQGIGGVAGVEAVPVADVRAELEACEGNEHCLAELGKLVGAARVVSGEVNELEEGQILYLKVVDVVTAKESGSTTAVLGKDEAGRQDEARAAAYRLLAPKAYLGRLELSVDVPGAVVYLDGQRVAKSPVKPLPVAVGTHALRVTHEQYRDYVRFVDVKFDAPTPLRVDLKAFPIVTEDMREKGRKRDPLGPEAPTPWYRRWYAVAGFGAGVALVTTIVVIVTVDRLDYDQDVTIGR